MVIVLTARDGAGTLDLSAAATIMRRPGWTTSTSHALEESYDFETPRLDIRWNEGKV
jgi:hypothetical protein